MKVFKQLPGFFFACITLFACTSKEVNFNPNDVGILHANEHVVTEIIIHDIFFSLKTLH